MGLTRGSPVWAGRCEERVSVRMRMVFGVILVAGVLGLGWLAYKIHGPQIEKDIRTRAELAISGISPHPISLDPNPSGRDIVVMGLADNEAQRDAILRAAESVDGIRNVIDRIEVLPFAPLYALRAIKNDGEWMIIGVAPTAYDQNRLETRARAFAGEGGQITLSLAAGVPAGDWVAAAIAGLDSLANLKKGEFSLLGMEATLRGEAESSSRLEQADLTRRMPSDAYQLKNEARLTLAAVSPYPITINMPRAGAISLTGHAPDAVSRQKIASLFGKDRGVVNNLTIAPGIEPGVWVAQIEEHLPLLRMMSRGKLIILDDQATLSGAVRDEAALSELNARLDDHKRPLQHDIEIESVRPPAEITLSLDRDRVLLITGTPPSALEIGGILERFSGAGVNFELFDNGSGDPVLFQRALTILMPVFDRAYLLEVTIQETEIFVSGLLPPGDDAARMSIELYKRLASMSPGFLDIQVNLMVATGDEQLFERQETVDEDILSGTTSERAPELKPKFQTQPDGSISARIAIIDGPPAHSAVIAAANDIEKCNRETAAALEAEPISFLTASPDLDADGRARLAPLRDLIMQCVNKGLRLVISGFADVALRPAANQTLSTVRAEVVRDELVKRGVPPTAMLSLGLGEANLKPRDTAAFNHDRSRRISLQWTLN